MAKNGERENRKWYLDGLFKADIEERVTDTMWTSDGVRKSNYFGRESVNK